MERGLALRIEDINMKLERAENLIICFCEFCESEGTVSGQDEESDRLDALIFVVRMQKYISLLGAASEILRRQNDELARISQSVKRIGNTESSG